MVTASDITNDFKVYNMVCNVNNYIICSVTYCSKRAKKISTCKNIYLEHYLQGL